MKKIVFLAALCYFGVQSSSIAQTKADSIASARTSDATVKRHFYIAAGAAFMDHKLNDKLAASGFPKISQGVFELSFGFNNTGEKFLTDLEFNADYYGDHTTTNDKYVTAAAGIKYRIHYIPYKTSNTFFSAGLDISYLYNSVDLYKKDNVIDLNNLDPDTHTGHISLYNSNLYLGPSVSLGAFQTKKNPLRLTTGYEWNVSRGSWKSNVAHVDNTVKENGVGRFYVKLI